MSSPKVLLGIVTYEGKDYVFDKFWKNIQSLTYDNFDVVVIDNTRTKKYYSKLKRRGVPVIHINRGANSRIAQAKSLNKIRDIMLKGDYEYFMSIESDLIPPIDIIQRLMTHNVDVVGCMYIIGMMSMKNQPPRPCLFVTEPKKDKPNSFRTANLDADVGFGLFGHGVIPIHGCGLGTTLIKRNIMEDIPFKYDLNKGKVIHSDVLFYMDMNNLKKTVYVDTDIIIPHFNSDWNLVKDA